MRNECSFGGYLIFANISDVLLIFLRELTFVCFCTIYEKKEKKGGRKKEKFDSWKTERDAFRKISLLSRANISSSVTDVERTRDVQCIRSMTHFAREVTRTVPKLDLIDRLYYLALSTAFCSWNLNHAKIGGGAPSSVRYYNS